MRQGNYPNSLRRIDDPNQCSRNVSMDALGSVVYAARLSDGSIKIGHTHRLSHRLHKLRSYRSCDVELLAAVPGTREDEAAIHARLTAYNMALAISDPGWSSLFTLAAAGCTLWAATVAWDRAFRPRTGGVDGPIRWARFWGGEPPAGCPEVVTEVSVAGFEGRGRRVNV